MHDASIEIKTEFMRKLCEVIGGKQVVIVHVDGKSLSQFHDQIKSVKKRLSIIANSPDLPSEQVLGVPITVSNSGKHQTEVVMKVLNDWGIPPFILCLGFDTTSDNTGRKK